ncbi:MAG TPA: hypothetical protein VJ779_04330 [Acetobacteraceae bacterium]|jgi:hypothetical protein|nr:hypothetical protein [Acetobacteraceae bacterium]
MKENPCTVAIGQPMTFKGFAVNVIGHAGGDTLRIRRAAARAGL